MSATLGEVMKKLIYSVSIMLLLAIASFAQKSIADRTDPNFRFEIKFTRDGKIIRGKAQEIAGLGEDARPDGDGKFRGYWNVTLRNAVFTSNDNINLLLPPSDLSAKVSPANIIIRLVDEAGKTAMVWMLKDAFVRETTGGVSNQNTISWDRFEIRYKDIEVLDVTEFDEQNPGQ